MADGPQNHVLEEPVFTTAEVAAGMKVHAETVRRLFSEEPGVIKLTSSEENGKPHRVTLRIPQHVLDRVLRRLSVGQNETTRQRRK